MSWTYSGDPAGSDLDAVRFEIGDTIDLDPLLQDNEILHALNLESTVLRAAVRCCEALARKFARQADSKLGPLDVKASQRALAYERLAQQLRSRIASSNAPYLGGLSKAEQQLDAQNTDLKKPAFRRGIMDNPASLGEAGE